MAIEPATLHTSDGLSLEAELATPPQTWAGVVLAHPHPTMGGSMRSIVPGALFAALPAVGIAALRFNFRGVEGSEGSFDDGYGERLDVVAALDTLFDIAEGLPLVLAGWSFGADTLLAVPDDRAAGWVAVAPPLRRPAELDVVGRDPRPKLLVVPEHDQFRTPASAEAIVSDAAWAATRLEVIRGADHFFVGRTDRVVALSVRFCEQLAGRAGAQSVAD